MDDLSAVRWLARDVLPPDELSTDVPAPVLVSTNLTPAVRKYISWWIRNADPAGRFAAKTRWLRRLPSPLPLRILLALGYDGFVYEKDAAIMGHVFFQRRGSALHAFSGAVDDPFGGRGYAVVMLFDCVAYASRLPGVDRARVGAGWNNINRRFLDRLKKREAQLGWRVEPDGWVTFR